MGWEYERAEDEYWSNVGDDEIFAANVARAKKEQEETFAANVQRAKDYGYTDEEIMGLDAWPWELGPNARAEQFRKARLATNIDISRTGVGASDVSAAQARVVAARRRAAAREMKARTSPIGEPESLLARADREAKEAFGGTLFKHGETPAVRRWLDQPSPYEPESRPVFRTERSTSAAGRISMINKSRTIANLKSTIADAQKELALLERIPPEPDERMTSFTVTFPGSNKPYVYVGLRVDGQWKMSGKHFEGSDWSWSGIFKRFEEIHATVSYISTPIEYRHEQVYS